MTEIREVANWFHEREGEMFEPEDHPFEREDVVEVLDDSVDPVQQIAVDGERFVGVVSYEEHDGWYEYTRWDDAEGKVNIGVCAACVKQANSVENVARTVGDDTETAKEKFDSHYSDGHRDRPADVETGATLLGGTTISGNQAIHLGNDGPGSGVDADTVRGEQALQKLDFREKSEPTNFLSSFLTPCQNPRGLGVGTDDSIWLVEESSPEVIKQFTRSGSSISQFTPSNENPRGLGLDSNDCIWHSDSSSNDLVQTDQTGNEITRFSTASANPEGVGIAQTGCIWNSLGSSVYRYDRTGTLTKQFVAPGAANPEGVGFDSGDSIWVADTAGEEITKVTKGGTPIKALNQNNWGSGNPAGVGFDTDGCLGNGDNVDGGSSELTKTEFVTF